MFFELGQKQRQNLKQLQKLMMSQQMQQAIHLMQMPVLELSAVIEEELKLNPLLEYDEGEVEEEREENAQDQEPPPEQELTFRDDDFEILKRLDEDFRAHFGESENFYTRRTEEEERQKTYLEQSIAEKETLFEHLMNQVHETFKTKKEKEMAEVLIGNFDASGFLQTSLSDIALLYDFKRDVLETVLGRIQEFDPFGVGARDVRECLLIQLRCREQVDTLAYKIIDRHFDDLIHNRILAIKSGLKVSVMAITAAIREKISHLDLHPGTSYSKNMTQLIIPDVFVKQEEDQLKILVNEDQLPLIRLNSRYLRMLDEDNLSKETKDFIRNKLTSAKWLLKNIDQRNKTLYRVVQAITKHQKSFFLNPEGKLKPLTMKVIAEDLELHESTIARAVANKYVDTPRGTVPLRYFFSNAYTTAQGDYISSKTVRDVLRKIIDDENKTKPLSDEAISKLLEKKGIACARRTVAKYRVEMQIGNAKQRKKF